MGAWLTSLLVIFGTAGYFGIAYGIVLPLFITGGMKIRVQRNKGLPYSAEVLADFRKKEESYCIPHALFWILTAPFYLLYCSCTALQRAGVKLSRLTQAEKEAVSLQMKTEKRKAEEAEEEGIRLLEAETDMLRRASERDFETRMTALDGQDKQEPECIPVMCPFCTRFFAAEEYRAHGCQSSWKRGWQ